MISFILASKNDGFEGDPIARLKCSLNENLKKMEGMDVEFLIGDWGSDDRITKEMLGVKSAKNVKIYYFPKEVTSKFNSKFDEVHPLNFLVRAAKKQFVGRLDQDIIIGQRFVNWLKTAELKDRLYWSIRRGLKEGVMTESPENIIYDDQTCEEFYKWAVGIVMAKKTTWEAIKGYNEALVFRNHMEHDLYKRFLKVLPMQNPIVNLGVLLDIPFFHLHHTRSEGEARTMNEYAPFKNDSLWGLAEYRNLIQVEV